MKYQDLKSDYLHRINDIKKYLNQCVMCQQIGYNPEKIEERNEVLFRERIKKLFKPLVLNSANTCSQCEKALDKTLKY